MTQPNATIHILDTHTANQIAAGEVVERPASVVKELVENAIDAGATSITVRLYDCGCERIRVTDNGCGMSAEDMRLAVQRHATSKIMSASDLNSLDTLGFRGEALPSIASVSFVTITSKRKDQEIGFRMTVQEGRASIPEECAANNGTTVEVDKLFYNAPARKKFLKSPRTELGLISDFVGRMAICRTDIAFTLQNGNHRIIVTAGNGNLEAAVISVFGNQVSRELLAVSAPDEKMHGLISLPTFTRSVRNNTFFVNGRLVRSKELALAVDQAYHTIIPTKRYPFTILFFQLPPESIDVNVHPAKLEIKLREPQPIVNTLVEMITEALQKNILSQPRLTTLTPFTNLQQRHPQRKYSTPDNDVSSLGESLSFSGTQLYKALRDGQIRYGNITTGKTEIKTNQHNITQQRIGEIVPLPVAKRPIPNLGSMHSTVEKEKQVVLASASENRATTETITENTNNSASLIFSTLTPLGQFAGTFILASAGEVLYIIDQHAAAERIQYEKILRSVEQSSSDSAMLAIPIQFELSHSEQLLLHDHILEIRDLGFILEHFGDASYVIRGVPVWLGETAPEPVLRDYLDYLREKGSNQQTQVRQRELFYMACRRAVKANRHLTNTDIVTLFAELDQCKESATCPHGRPICLRLTLEDIYKHFLRGSI